ncbi:hypothetical protein PP590_gp57 [Pseudoalteromonas phage HS1]|nr:hypothetical protein PP589_gp11 [Pseudoalteromonas phage HS5]YP_010660214.1 hypothetical protein PP590_gp57 [Pseudoalteromonas phage HS1]
MQALTVLRLDSQNKQHCDCPHCFAHASLNQLV